jgi:site-specific DNA recombinase
VRVILRNEKYVGRWVYGRRIFVKDPVTGRRQARVRPKAEWQVTEHADLRIVTQELWEAVQAKFGRLATEYPRARGRLAGRARGAPSWRPSLFSGVLRCGTCGGALVVVSGQLGRSERRYGCGFHREKGPHVCANALTVKVDTVEERLLDAVRSRVLNEGAVRYLITAVNAQLDQFRAAETETRRELEKRLEQVSAELRNVEHAILAGIVTETTAALVTDREAQRRDLKERLAAMEACCAADPLPVDTSAITRHLERLQDVLKQDSPRVNTFLRQHLAPIDCIPMERQGRRFYRAVATANGADIGGCGGPL